LICKKCGALFPNYIAKCPQCDAGVSSSGGIPAKSQSDTDIKNQPPKNIKIYQPEPNKPSRLGKIFLLSALFIIVCGVFFILAIKPKLEDKKIFTLAGEAVPNKNKATVDISEFTGEQERTHADSLQDERLDRLNKEGGEYFDKGDYKRARKIYEAALAIDPSHAVIKANIAAALANIGRQEIENTNYEIAVKIFQDALVYNPQLHSAHKNIGIAYIKHGDAKKAAPYIDTYIEKSPADLHNKNLLFMLAETFLANGDRNMAVLYFEKVLNIDPHNSEVSRRLALLNRENQAEQGFQKKEGSHFTVKFEGGENSDIGHTISIILEEAYVKVGSDIGYYPADRIEAVLYTQQQFTDVTRAPSWAGAIYDGRIKMPAGGITSRTNLLERVLFHEYAHALVHRLSKGRAPVWLNEGIAQHVEGAVNENINEVLSFVAKSEKPLPLRTFEGSFMGFNNVQAAVAYSISLSATEYIINEFGMSAVKRILENLGENKTVGEAISSTLYLSYEDFQKNWFMALKKKFYG
jgi:tetratricopeptide (TPR) repeat protein